MFSFTKLILTKDVERWFFIYLNFEKYTAKYSNTLYTCTGIST